MWFAWKYLSLWYQQQPAYVSTISSLVVICLKISIFVVSTTTFKQLIIFHKCCDLLENIYLCGINNNAISVWQFILWVVICLKISTFVVSTTTKKGTPSAFYRCDLLENIYLCGINNNWSYLYLLRSLLWFAWKYLPLWYQQQHQLR